MFESSQSFSKDLQDLISHLNHEKTKGEFLKKTIRKHKRKSILKSDLVDHISRVENPSLISSKQFTYRSSIISLYGFLEKFLENLVHEFIANLNQIKAPIESLPKSIRESHLESSIDLLKKIQRRRTYSKDHKNTLIKEIVGNMNSCLQKESNYQLNEGAFSIHTSNFRYDTIHNTFCKIGLPSVPKMALRNQQLKHSLTNKHTIDSNVEQKVLVSLLTSELDDLAQRRNEIAHGSFDGELESIELVIERIQVLKDFGAAISHVLTNYFMGISFSLSNNIELGNPQRSYSNINVLGFEATRHQEQAVTSKIEVGNIIFAKNNRSNVKLKHGRIVSIINNNIKTNSMNIPSLTDFAIKVDLDINSHFKNRYIYIAPSK